LTSAAAACVVSTASFFAATAGLDTPRY
jgi:hypothetical protein